MLVHLRNTVLSSYYDGELPPATAESVERHLDECGECRSEYEKMAAVANGLRHLPALRAPSTLMASVRERIDSEERGMVPVLRGHILGSRKPLGLLPGVQPGNARDGRAPRNGSPPRLPVRGARRAQDLFGAHSDVASRARAPARADELAPFPGRLGERLPVRRRRAGQGRHDAHPRLHRSERDGESAGSDLPERRRGNARPARCRP